MLKDYKNKKTLLYLTLTFVVFVVWWFSFQTKLDEDTLSIKIFNSIYGLFALAGGIIGLVVSRKWGGTKSVLGKALALFSLGLFAQEFGQIVYAIYYYVLKVEVPYPSLGDLGYFGSIPLYIYGAILLARASGASFSMKSLFNKVQAFIIPLALLAGSYFIFLRGYEFDWSNPLTIFLDFGYPFGQAIYLSIALLAFLLSRKLLGGTIRPGILMILFALFVQYVSDFTFLYQTNHETWKAGGVNDLMYLFSYFVMSIALLKFSSLYSKLQVNTAAMNPDTEDVEDKQNG